MRQSPLWKKQRMSETSDEPFATPITISPQSAVDETDAPEISPQPGTTENTTMEASLQPVTPDDGLNASPQSAAAKVHTLETPSQPWSASVEASAKPVAAEHGSTDSPQSTVHGDGTMGTSPQPHTTGTDPVEASRTPITAENDSAPNTMQDSIESTTAAAPTTSPVNQLSTVNSPAAVGLHVTHSHSTELILPPAPLFERAPSLHSLPSTRSYSLESSAVPTSESALETATVSSIHAQQQPGSRGVGTGQGFGQAGQTTTPTLPDVSIAAMLASGVHVYGWGRGDLGQLGNGREEAVLKPELVQSLEGKAVVHIASNMYNSAILTVEGELYMCGANDNLQVGSKGVSGNAVLPRRVAALDAHKVTHVAMGSTHTLVLTEDGSMFGWGAGDFGQLGLGSVCTDVPLPKAVKLRGESRWCGVSAGAEFSLGLRCNSDVYGWGQGTAGQLGTGAASPSVASPAFVPRLWSVGVQQVCCGDQFSAALCIDGRVFTWGRNKYGQLGLGDLNNAVMPTPVPHLTGVVGRQVSCGGDHTLLLAAGGSCYSWGRGTWGQLGHGSTDNVLYPRPVDMGQKQVVQVSAGNRHSLALCSDNSVWAWGCGEDGQLGTGDIAQQLLPVEVEGMTTQSGKVLYVVAGGDHSFAVVRPTDNASGEAAGFVHDYLYGSGLRPVQIPRLVDLARQAEKDPNNKQLLYHLRRAVEDVFYSPAFLRHTFAAAPSAVGLIVEEDTTGEVEEGDHSSPLQPSTASAPSSSSSKAGSQADDLNMHHGLDVMLITNTYALLLKLYNTEILGALATSANKLLAGMLRAMQHGSGIRQPELLPALFILLQCPLMSESHGTGSQLISKLSQVFMRLTPKSHKTLERWIATLPPEILASRVVRPIQRYISSLSRYYSGGGTREQVLSAGKLLGHVFRGNERRGKPIIAVSEFYNKDISEDANLQAEYIRFLQLLDSSYNTPHSVPLVTLCQLPFLLTPSAKSSILHMEAALQKQKELQTNQMQALMGGFHPAYLAAVGWLDIRVRREHVLEDALNQILARPNHLKKPLRVTFISAGVPEEAVDEGGVTKEFFQLLTRELLNENFGMFVYNESTRTFWFNPVSMEGAHEFQLVGAVLGLAIYNGVLLDMHFPLVVYKKLLGLKATFEDLVEAFPEFGQGLQQLMDYQGDVYDTFVQTFSVEYDYFGEIRTHDLKAGGSHIPVTNTNRQEYVDLITQWKLSGSIQPQFEAFRKGFYSVCGGPALTLFRYNELELLVCGLPHFDFADLQKAARYEGGYSPEHQTIKDLWNILHSFNLDQKKKFLLFTTGSDRAPVGGLSQLHLLIQRGGPDSSRLPSSHTCFNALLLPEYSSKHKMTHMLQLAIDNAQGFGLQ